MSVHRLELELDNEPGVLARICSVLHRHAGNIETLDLRAQDPKTAAAVMTLSCPNDDVSLIAARLRGLVNVRTVALKNHPTAVAQSTSTNQKEEL